jgi:hypothetical protein
VNQDGVCEFGGKTDSIAAEGRHREVSLIGTTGRANREGAIEFDLQFQDKKGEPIGKVANRGIAKHDGRLLVMCVGRAWSDTRLKSIDQFTQAACNNRNHATLMVLGAESK